MVILYSRNHSRMRATGGIIASTGLLVSKKYVRMSSYQVLEKLSVYIDRYLLQ